MAPNREVWISHIKCKPTTHVLLILCCLQKTQINLSSINNNSNFMPEEGIYNNNTKESETGY